MDVSSHELCPLEHCPLEQNLLVRMDVSSILHLLSTDLDIVPQNALSMLGHMLKHYQLAHAVPMA